MSALATDNLPSAPQVRNAVGKFDRAVKLQALRLEHPDARRLSTELYFELLHLSVYGDGLAFGVTERGLEYGGDLVLAADSAPWVQSLWGSGFRQIAIEPGMEEAELHWLLELLAEEESHDLAWRAWAQNPPQIRFHIAALPSLQADMDAELNRLTELIESSSTEHRVGTRREAWTGDREKDVPAPDPKLRHSIVRELQTESLHLLGQRLLQRLLDTFRPMPPDIARNHVENLGWVLWHFAHQPELRASSRLLHELQDICHAFDLHSFGEDAFPTPAPASPTEVEAVAGEALERIEAILSQPEVSAAQVSELLQKAEATALEGAASATAAPVAPDAEPVFRAYKGIKFTVSAGPTAESREASRSRERRREEAFWKVDTDAQGDDVIDALFGEVFGDEPEEAPKLLAAEPPVARPKPAPAPASFEVEEASIDLAALGFDPALLRKRPAPDPVPRRSEPEPDRPELLWSDMDLDTTSESEVDSEPPRRASPEPVRPRIESGAGSEPVQALSSRPERVEDPQHAETQKLRLHDIQAAVQDATHREAAQPAPADRLKNVSEALARGRVLRAQGRLVEARHLLHRVSKEAPADPAVADEFRRVQNELRLNCARQLRNEALIPQLQLPPGSAQLQALLQAPTGGVLRRVNGASTLKEIRSQLELPPEEFEKQMSSLMEWGFVTLTSRKR